MNDQLLQPSLLSEQQLENFPNRFCQNDHVHQSNDGTKYPSPSSRKRRRDEKSPITSPFFQKQRNRRQSSPYSESAYFCRSPSSAYGAVQMLGSLLHCLSGGKIPCKLGSGCLSGCSTCQDVIDEAVRHFSCCGLFQNAWVSNQCDSTQQHSCHQTSKETMCSVSEKKLERCVRHLCPFRCYARAYAPYRDWWSLRNALIKKQFGTSINELLSGWKCILLHATDLTASSFKEGGITIPRTAFISPDNRMFTKKVEVLKELEYSSVPNSKCEVDISSIFFMEQRINLRPLSLHCNSTRESSIGTNKTLERAGPSDMKMKIKMADTDDVASPFGLLEELFSNDPWKLLLSTIFLNRTSRSQVDPILHPFLDKWPTASAAVEADLHEMSTLLKPLGLHHQRAAGIIQFSGDYLSLLSHGSVSCTGDGSTFSLPVDASESKSTRLTREDILRIFNCGEYAGDAFKIFIQKCNDFVPTDAVLKVYVEYQRARSLDL